MPDESRNMKDRLTDEDIARLMDPELDPQERERLIERLGDDPGAAQLLALAQEDTPPGADGFSDDEINLLLDVVNDHKTDLNICPHCSGDLHPTGEYCPHCAAQVRGNVVRCIRCSKPVRDGSSYCPHCGSTFRKLGASAWLDSQFVLLIVGLLSIFAFVVSISLDRYAGLLFLMIGLILLASWWLGKPKRPETEGRVEDTPEDSTESGSRDAGKRKSM
jgi:hypothetical protein